MRQYPPPLLLLAAVLIVGHAPANSQEIRLTALTQVPIQKPSENVAGNEASETHNGTTFAWTPEAIAACVNAFSSTVLALLTAVYIRQNHRLVNAALSATRPSVAVEIDFKREYVNLILVNRSQVDAIDVKLEVSDMLPWYEGEGISRLDVVKDGVSCLPAGSKLAFYAGYLIYRSLEDGLSLTVNATWTSESGSLGMSAFSLTSQNIKSLAGGSSLDFNGKVLSAVDRIEQSIGKIANALRPDFNDLLTQMSRRNAKRSFENIGTSAESKGTADES